MVCIDRDSNPRWKHPIFMVVDIEEEVGALLTCKVEKKLSGRKNASNASLRRCLKVEALSTLE